MARSPESGCNPKVRSCPSPEAGYLAPKPQALDLVVPPAMLRLRGLTLAYRRRRPLLLAKLAQDASREQDAPLPLRVLGEECYLLASSLQRDLLVTALQAFA